MNIHCFIHFTAGSLLPLASFYHKMNAVGMYWAHLQVGVTVGCLDQGLLFGNSRACVETIHFHFFQQLD